MAAPTLFAQGALFAAAAGTSITPVIPANDANNDYAIFVAWCNAASTFSTPAGWSTFGTAVNSANMSAAAFRKRLTGSDSNPISTTSATGSSTIGLYGVIYVYRGCLTSADPFESVGNAGTPTLNTTPQTSQVVTTAAQRLVVSIVMVDDDNPWASGNPPSGWENHGTRLISTVGGDAMVDAISRVVTSADTITAATIGTQAASDYWRTLSFALIPEPSAPIPGAATASYGYSVAATGLRVPSPQAPSTRAPIVAVLMVTTPGDWNVHPYYKATVTPANWGNSTDLAAVDSALAAWPQRTRVVLIAEDDGTANGRCVTALNWAARHYDQVQAIALRAPIIDLEERHDRVGGAEATSIETAYGGAGWADEMMEWNPGANHRLHIFRNLFNRSMHIWRDNADSVTPAATTDAIATTIRATLHTTLGSIADVVPDGQDWPQQKAREHEKKLHDYARTSANNSAWKSADGAQTVVLPDGRWVTLFSDTAIGVIDPDDTWASLAVIRNSIMIHDGNGDVTGQFYSGAPGTVALLSDQTENPGSFYWLIGGCMESGLLNIVCDLRTGPGLGDALDRHIVRLDPDDFSTDSTISLGDTELRTSTIYPDSDSGFIYGVTINPSQLWRTPIGSLHDLASYRYWDGSGWNADKGQISPVLRNLPGGGTEWLAGTTVGSGDTGGEWDIRRWKGGWLALGLTYLEPYIAIYYADQPQGPYDLYTHIPIPNVGGLYYGFDLYGYFPFWHPERDDGLNRLMIGYSTITFGSNVTTDEGDFIHLDPHFVMVDMHRDPFA